MKIEMLKYQDFLLLPSSHFQSHSSNFQFLINYDDINAKFDTQINFSSILSFCDINNMRKNIRRKMNYLIAV